MTVDADAEALREAMDRALESRIVERHETPALLADQVMVVLTARLRALEPRLPVPHLHSLHQTVLDQQVEHPVDAGATDRLRLGPQRVFYLHRAERAGFLRKQLDHSLARAPALESRARELGVNVLAPSSGHREKTSARTTGTGMRLIPILCYGGGVRRVMSSRPTPPVARAVALAAAALLIAACGSAATGATGSVRIVAAENFWGSIAAQLRASSSTPPRTPIPTSPRLATRARSRPPSW